MIMEPIFEADFEASSHLDFVRRRSAHCDPASAEAILRARPTSSTLICAPPSTRWLTSHLVLEKVARRVDDDAVLWLLKLFSDGAGEVREFRKAE